MGSGLGLSLCASCSLHSFAMELEDEFGEARDGILQEEREGEGRGKKGKMAALHCEQAPAQPIPAQPCASSSGFVSELCVEPSRLQWVVDYFN